MSGGNRSAYESRALTACAPNEHFLWNFNKQPARKIPSLGRPLCDGLLKTPARISKKYRWRHRQIGSLRLDWWEAHQRKISGL